MPAYSEFCNVQSTCRDTHTHLYTVFSTKPVVTGMDKQKGPHFLLEDKGLNNGQINK